MIRTTICYGMKYLVAKGNQNHKMTKAEMRLACTWWEIAEWDDLVLCMEDQWLKQWGVELIQVQVIGEEGSMLIMVVKEKLVFW